MGEVVGVIPSVVVAEISLRCRRKSVGNKAVETEKSQESMA